MEYFQKYFKLPHTAYGLQVFSHSLFLVWAHPQVDLVSGVLAGGLLRVRLVVLPVLPDGFLVVLLLIIPRVGNRTNVGENRPLPQQRVVFLNQLLALACKRFCLCTEYCGSVL